MTTDRTYGRYVFGLGVVAMAILGFVLGDFIPGQPLPKWFPDRTVLAYAAMPPTLARWGMGIDG